MRSPLWKISTPRAVMRASTSVRAKRWGGVIVGVDVDVIVDPDPAAAPLAVFVRLPRQRLQRRAIDLLEQLAACDAEPAQGLAFVELRHQFTERGVDVGETVEDPSPKPAEEPALLRVHPDIHVEIAIDCKR